MKTHKEILIDFEQIGLVVNGQPVSKTKFKEIIDVHTYGRGRNNIKVGYCYTHPKELMYSFEHVYAGVTKKDLIDLAYTNYKAIVGGELYPLIAQEVNYGNSGLPISYHKIYQR